MKLQPSDGVTICHPRVDSRARCAPPTPRRLVGSAFISPTNTIAAHGAQRFFEPVPVLLASARQLEHRYTEADELETARRNPQMQPVRNSGRRNWFRLQSPAR